MTSSLYALTTVLLALSVIYIVVRIRKMEETLFNIRRQQVKFATMTDVEQLIQDISETPTPCPTTPPAPCPAKSPPSSPITKQAVVEEHAEIISATEDGSGDEVTEVTEEANIKKEA